MDRMNRGATDIMYSNLLVLLVFSMSTVIASLATKEYSAVSSFAVVTSPHTTQRFLGPGLPEQYATAVPALRNMIDYYLERSQTMAFCPIAEAGGLDCDLHSDPRSGGHKVVVLPETTLPQGGGSVGAALLAFAERGGAVVVSGGALLFDANGSPLGSFTSELGNALGLSWKGTHGAATTAGCTLNITKATNPEWWRLISLDNVHPGAPILGASQNSAGSIIGELQVVRPTSTDTMVLATATLADGARVPVVTATRVGARGWLIYTASSSTPVIEAAVNFVLAATGIFLNPGAGGLAGHSPMSIAGAPNLPLPANDRFRKFSLASEATALLSYRAPADPTVSLEGVYRVSIIGAASGSRVCVQVLDNWWGDNPPSHTLVDQSRGTIVTAEVSYAGALACIGFPNTTTPTHGDVGVGETNDTTVKELPWFELRTAASGTSVCTNNTDCELNGVCTNQQCRCNPGWTGPSCGTLDVLPAPVRGVWPHYRPNASTPISFPRQYEPVSWGFTSVQDAKTKKYHAFADTGCYTPSSVMHVTGFQLPHMVGDSPLGPFQATTIAAPPTHFNPVSASHQVLTAESPISSYQLRCVAFDAFNGYLRQHAYHFDDGSETGIYVLYTNGGGFRDRFWADVAETPAYTEEEQHKKECAACCVECSGPKCCPQCPPCVSPTGTCNGEETQGKHNKLPFVHPAGNCTSALCAVFANSLDGPWTMRNVESPCTNNAVPFQLKNGSLLMGGTCGGNTATHLPGTDSEQIWLGIAEPNNFFGPFVKINGTGFGGNLWPENEPGEDPTIFQDTDENVHLLFHGYQWQGLWTGMHAYATKELDNWAVSRRIDGKGAFQTNVTWDDGSGWTKFYRRERPELHLDDDGNPSVFYSGIEYGMDHPQKQYSFSIVQQVRGGKVARAS